MPEQKNWEEEKKRWEEKIRNERNRQEVFVTTLYCTNCHHHSDYRFPMGTIVKDKVKSITCMICGVTGGMER